MVLYASSRRYGLGVIRMEVLRKLPEDFYATRSYTDLLMDMIRSNRGDGKPFFAYLAYTAVHDPFHVPEPWLSLYKGRYDDGFAALKSRRSAGATSGPTTPGPWRSMPA